MERSFCEAFGLEIKFKAVLNKLLLKLKIKKYI